MPIVKVTLDEETGTLQVDQDPVQIPPDANPQSIHWHLSGNAYPGKFKSLTGTPPGFAWSGPEPISGIFDPPTLSDKKKALTLKDKNPPDKKNPSKGSKGSIGEWAYSLSAVVGGVTYQTGGLVTAGSQDPIIKNN